MSMNENHESASRRHTIPRTVGDFTDEQAARLNALPAVEAVLGARIVYAPGFKRACLERYMQGASPVALFRSAGLGPELVGSRRVSKCFARWHANRDRILMIPKDPNENRFFHAADQPATEPPLNSTGKTMGESNSRHDPEWRDMVSAGATSAPQAETADAKDPRDLLIGQLIRYIDGLEHENQRLRAAIRENEDHTRIRATEDADRTTRSNETEQHEEGDAQ